MDDTTLQKMTMDIARQLQAISDTDNSVSFLVMTTKSSKDNDKDVTISHTLCSGLAGAIAGGIYSFLNNSKNGESVLNAYNVIANFDCCERQLVELDGDKSEEN